VRLHAPTVVQHAGASGFDEEIHVVPIASEHPSRNVS